MTFVPSRAKLAKIGLIQTGVLQSKKAQTQIYPMHLSAFSPTETPNTSTTNH